MKNRSKETWKCTEDGTITLIKEDKQQVRQNEDNFNSVFYGICNCKCHYGACLEEIPCCSKCERCNGNIIMREMEKHLNTCVCQHLFGTRGGICEVCGVET